MDIETQKQIIIIVDDNSVSLKAGKVMLKGHYQVFTVQSGEKLFELLHNVRPNLILLDVEMPGMNGYEVIKHLKSQESTKNIPVIFLTSHGEVENELEGLNLGAIDYLSKPFSAPLLLKRIETNLLMISQAEELRYARDQAEAANQSKSAFLAHTSHEIRTPLNAIIGMSELMRVDNLDVRQKSYLRDIQDMSKSLLHIINDILDISKIEAGKMEIVPVHFRLNEVYMHLCSAYRCLAMNKDLEFRSSLDPHLPEVIYGDELRIRQIITNILGNALKYTRQGYVELRIEKIIRNDCAQLIVVIADSGMGIKNEDMQNLFSAFRQLDQEENRLVQGTGLGLAITLKFAQLMGGTIECRSEYGKGSVFTVYLPLIEGDVDKVKSDADVIQVVAKEDIPVLVVDDNSINLTVALGFLATHNIKAESALSGAEALYMIEKKASSGSPYDLVFMDHMMPEMDGLEATRRIREWEQKTNQSKPLPIIALTANAITGVEQLFFAAGMNDFMSKPIITAELNRLLVKWLPPEKIGPVIESVVSKTSSQVQEITIDTVLQELALIEDLDVTSGLTHVGQNRECYFLILRQFSDSCDAYIEELTAAVKNGSWKDYCIKVHALKAIFSAFGIDKLSQWAARLEKASKNIDAVDTALCQSETSPFCSSLSAFRDRLRRTSLFNINFFEKTA